MPCYILRAGDTDKVKIGWAASSVTARIQEIQAGCWERFHLLRAIPQGTRFTEAWLHRRFAEKRLDRDWFEFDPEMLTIEPEHAPPPAEPRITPPSSNPMDLIRSERGLMAKIAKDLGVTRAAVCTWKRIPAEKALDVERITGISRQTLRPDLYPAPEAA